MVSIKGYVLEKPRVGSANSPFTSSPDNLVFDSGTYNSAYGVDEDSPGRTEYLALSLVDGDLADAEFGWTKNEAGVQRFDYDGRDQRFRPLPGSTRQIVGVLDATSNTTRFKVAVPTEVPSVSPYRVSVGSVASGTTFTVTTVATDGSFTTPATKQVQLSLATGNLHWNTSDITTTYISQTVYFQRQSFFTLKESTGRIGLAEDTLLLNPIPGVGVGGARQRPLVRFGFGLYFTPVDVVDEASFSSDPVRGTFEWARDTGRLKFNSVDAAANVGEPVYYDGVLFESAKTLSRQNLGTVSSPASISGLPSSGVDLVFRAKKAVLTGTATFPLTTVLQDGSANFVSSKVKSGDIAILTSGTYSGSRRKVTGVATTQLTVAPPFPSVTGATYSIEKAADIYQFPETLRVDSIASGKAGQVQVDGTGAVGFSSADTATYGSRTAEVVIGDLPLERGISMRFARNQVDPSAESPDLKDVSTFFAVEDSIMADPIIGQTSVFLPVLPIDDDAYPTLIEVVQGTGTFTGTLPRLDIGSPPTGLGYTLDFDNRQIFYAVRRNAEVVDILDRVAAVGLPDPLLVSSNVTLELNQGAGYSALTVGDDALLDTTSGVVTFVTKQGTLVAEGSTGSVSILSTLTDLAADFVTAGVLVDDLVVVTTGALKGVYTVTSVVATALGVEPSFASTGTGVQYQVRRGKEILADRFFQEVVLLDRATKIERIRSLGTVSNSPRLSVPKERIGSTRFRFASGLFSSLVTVVATDGSFTTPSSLGVGVVEISQATGNANFSQVDVVAGGAVFAVFNMIQGSDYRMSPDLGLVQFIERMLSRDEVLFTYASTSNPTLYVEERGAFLVRKELMVHSTPTTTLPFNATGRTVALTPAAKVFRGGRPQSSAQVVVSETASTVTFLPDVLPTVGGSMLVTDVLPHGAIVSPIENVYIDYYVYEALGGEDTLSVLNPPINLAQLAIVEGESTFTLTGDWTAEVPVNRLIRIDSDQLYYVSASVYPFYNPDTGAGPLTQFTITQTFRDSANNPKLYVTSGDIRLTAVGALPSYFTLEAAPYDPIPRGMTVFRVQGDKASSYSTGTVAYFSGSGFNEYYLISGSKYDATKDRTEITITQTVARQYVSPTFTLKRSVRPIYEAATTKVHTSETPLVVAPATNISDAVILYRQVESQPGVLLTPTVDFKIDDSGAIALVTPLLPGEEVSAFYSRYRFVNPGQLRASYTANIAPSDSNGLINQRLVASFTTYMPDSFFFRVETMTNFRAEVAAQYLKDAQASSPSGGPRTSNSSQPKLYEQGSESIYFTEGHLLNEDIIARNTLKAYNDSVNYLEDLLRNMDGRVVGDHDGKLIFDGTTGTIQSSFSSADNQIDDSFKISDFPIDITPPLFPIKYTGTYLRAYEASTSSRFYPTFRNKYGYTVAGADTSAKTGDAILDFQTKGLTGSQPTASRRTPRAVLTRSAKAGDLTVYVDTTAQVDTVPFRPAFANSMKVVMRDTSATYVTQGSPLTIASKTSTSITLSAGLPVDVPIGASVYLADKDTTYRKSYRIGFDTTLDVDKGYLLYVKPYPPYDGTVGAVPAELEVQTPDSNELLEAGVFLNNRLTSPDRFPALDGLSLDDDGDQRLPLINPSPARELGAPGYLETELTYISPSGLLLSNSVTPFVGTGNLNVGGTVITLASGTFPAPAPQVGDLVRVLSGANGTTSFRRITAATTTAVTVDVAFASAPDTGFSFLVTVAANLASGTLSTIAGAVLTDTFANFITAGVKPGHTVLITQIGHGSYLERRQVQSVNSATQLTLTAPFTSLIFPTTYRAHNPLDTYSDVGDLPSAPGSLLGILQSNSDSEVNSIDAFFTQVMTDRLSPATASGSVSGTTLTGTGVDFVTDGVLVGDLVYVPATQTNQGFYTVEEVTSATTLTVKESFPSAGAVTFRVVDAFGASAKTMGDLLDMRVNAAAFYASSTSWSTLVSTVVPVTVPPGVTNATYFARGYTSADFTARVSSVNARKAYVTTAIPKVETALTSDRFYDKRYVWIDARINVEKGILVKQVRAVADRLKAQQETLKQLIKLLAVEG